VLLHGWACSDRSSSPSRESLDGSFHSRTSGTKLPAKRGRCYRDRMFDYPSPILHYWRGAFEGTVAKAQGDFILSVVPTLSRKRPAMMLEGPDGSIQAAITPELAAVINLDVNLASAASLRERLANEGITFHDPDLLFYLPTDTVAETGDCALARRLTEDDRAAFDAFHAAASEQDREDSYVELDQWAVFGCYDGDRLVSAASAILWSDSPVADLGVLTLPDALATDMPVPLFDRSTGLPGSKGMSRKIDASWTTRRPSPWQRHAGWCYSASGLWPPGIEVDAFPFHHPDGNVPIVLRAVRMRTGSSGEFVKHHRLDRCRN